MARKNIFEIAKTKWDIDEEATRLARLFMDIKTISRAQSYSISSFVKAYCFKDWMNRERFIDADDYLAFHNFSDLLLQTGENSDSLLTVLEIMYNFYYLAARFILKNHPFSCNDEFHLFKRNLDNCLNHYNYKGYYFEEKEQLIVAEDDPAVTAVAETTNLETAYQIVRYNHFTLKGDIDAKKGILIFLASELEPKRTKLKGLNKTYEGDIFYLFNNMNLRHNNCDPATKYYNKYVADMPKDALEGWYDELYQMVLLANLEIDNLTRSEKITELKTHLAK